MATFTLFSLSVTKFHHYILPAVPPLAILVAIWLDDLLEVRSRLTDLGAATLRAEQVIGREGTDVARLGLRIACVTADGRPTRIPAPLREALKPYC